MRLKRMIAAGAVAAAMAGGATVVAAPAANAATNAVSPRSACGGFNGNIEWHITDPVSNSGEIHVWGELWDNNCPGSSEQLWVKWKWSGESNYQFAQLATVTYSGTTGVNWGPNYHIGNNYTGIGIYVCQTTSSGRSCGPTVFV